MLAAEEIATARQREKAERSAIEQARMKRERAAAWVTYLDGLVGREAELWRQVARSLKPSAPKRTARRFKLFEISMTSAIVTVVAKNSQRASDRCVSDTRSDRA